jgi:hypothetical protein
MAIGPGVTEIADSDEEPLTSSPAAKENANSDKLRLTAGQDIQAVACPAQEAADGVANSLLSRTVCLDVDQQQPSINLDISRVDHANSQSSNQTATNHSTCTTNGEQANLLVSQVGSDTAVAELQREDSEQHDEGNGSSAAQDTRRPPRNESRTMLDGPASMPADARSGAFRDFQQTVPLHTPSITSTGIDGETVATTPSAAKFVVDVGRHGSHCTNDLSGHAAMPVDELAKSEMQGRQPQGKNGSAQETATEQLIPLEETNMETQAVTARTARNEHEVFPVQPAEAVAEQAGEQVATSFTESIQPLHQHQRGIDSRQLAPTTPRNQPKSQPIASQARQSLSPPSVSQLTPQEITLAELKAQKAYLLASLRNLPAIQVLIEGSRLPNVDMSDEEAEPTDAEVTSAANKIVKEHIKLLHEYNELKDVGQGMMGLIADQRGSRIAEVQEEFGIDAND